MNNQRYYHHATARYLGGTMAEFTCNGCGHVWREDLAFPRGKRYPHIRLSESAVAHIVRWWEKGRGVTVCCPRCRKAHPNPNDRLKAARQQRSRALKHR
jgi:rubredoxin